MQFGRGCTKDLWENLYIVVHRTTAGRPYSRCSGKRRLPRRQPVLHLLSGAGPQKSHSVGRLRTDLSCTLGQISAGRYSDLFDRNAASCYDLIILGGGNAMQRNSNCHNLMAGSRGWGRFIYGLSTYGYFTIAPPSVCCFHL